MSRARSLVVLVAATASVAALAPVASAAVTLPQLPGVPLPPVTLPLPDLPLPVLPTPTPGATPTPPSLPGAGSDTPASETPGAPTAPSRAAEPAGAYDPGPARYGIAKTTDVPIRMRDGVTLRADVYRPTDKATGKPAAGPFPVILSETPYGKQLTQYAPGSMFDEMTGYQPALITRGYVQVILDVRGAGGSEGTFDLLSPTEQKDSVEVIDFVSKLPGTTGKVGMLGHSYVGITQLLAATRVGPNSPLKAIFPIMATNDPYRDLASDGGMLNLASVPPYAGLVTTTSTAGSPAQLPRSPKDAIALTTQHAIGSTLWSTGTLSSALLGRDEAYDQTYWRDRSPGANLDKIVANGVAAFLIGGGYDVFQAGEVNNFVGLQNAAAGKPVGGALQTSQPLSPRYQLMFGPWYHQAHFDEFDLPRTELAWFDHHLKGISTGIEKTTTPLHVVEAGGGRYDSTSLPVAGAVPSKLYLGKDSLSGAAPTSPTASDTFLWSGAGPACNRSVEQWYTGLPNQALNLLGAQDPCAERRRVPQRSIGQRSYTTDALDAPMQIAGPATLTVQARSTTKDAEFVVTLQDVDASGKVVDLTSGALLGSHRATDPSLGWPGAGNDPLLVWHPYTKAAKRGVIPGKVTRFDVSLRPVFATVPKGHRLRVVLATSELPHLIAIPGDLTHLLGGIYEVQRNRAAPSFLQVSARRVLEG